MLTTYGYWILAVCIYLKIISAQHSINIDNKVRKKHDYPPGVYLMDIISMLQGHWNLNYSQCRSYHLGLQCYSNTVTGNAGDQTDAGSKSFVIYSSQ